MTNSSNNRNGLASEQDVTYVPSITLLPIDTVLNSVYKVTEPFGLLWEKHLIKRVGSFTGTRYFIASKLGTERERIHKSYKRLFNANLYFVELEMEAEA